MNRLQNTISPLQQSAAFDLAFRLRQPLPAQPKACVLLLHGVGGSEMNLAELALAMDPDTLVVLPRGPLAFAPGQFGWFRVSFTASGPSIVATEAEHSRQALIRFVGQLQATYGIAAQNTVIAGFSQGGILSASVALSAPERVAGFAVLSGRILPELEPHITSKERLAKLRGFIAHGEYDSKLPVAWAQRSDQWLDQLGVAHVTWLYPMDHEISAATKIDFLAWLREQTPTDADLQLRDSALRAGAPAGQPVTLLHIGTDQTTVASVSGAAPAAMLTLALGSQKTAADFFKHLPPTPFEMENAIMAVEDEVSRARSMLADGSVLITTDPAIREIALIAGLPDQPEMVLTLDVMERTFDRLTAVTLGRPAVSAGLPDSATFAATLLILREFMHHLQFAAITVKA
jgi:phospholipase/carboxylesterase